MILNKIKYNNADLSKTSNFGSNERSWELTKTRRGIGYLVVSSSKGQRSERSKGMNGKKENQGFPNSSDLRRGVEGMRERKRERFIIVQYQFRFLQYYTRAQCSSDPNKKPEDKYQLRFHIYPSCYFICFNFIY